MNIPIAKNDTPKILILFLALVEIKWLSCGILSLHKYRG